MTPEPWRAQPLPDDEQADLRIAYDTGWLTLLAHVTDLADAYRAQGYVMGDLAHDGTLRALYLPRRGHPHRQRQGVHRTESPYRSAKKGGAMSGEELRALAEAATTRSVWRVDPNEPQQWLAGALIVGECREDADAAFIAAANPTAVLALLDERDALRAQVERVRALGNSWVGFDNSHHYGDAVLVAISPAALDGPQ